MRLGKSRMHVVIFIEATTRLGENIMSLLKRGMNFKIQISIKECLRGKRTWNEARKSYRDQLVKWKW